MQLLGSSLHSGSLGHWLGHWLGSSLHSGSLGHWLGHWLGRLGSNNCSVRWHSSLGGLDSSQCGLGGSVKELTSGIGLGVLIGVFHYVMLCYVIIDGAFYLTPRFSEFRDYLMSVTQPTDI